jgi:hypothetical protein
VGILNQWDSLAHGACLLGTKPVQKKPKNKKQSKKK